MNNGFFENKNVILKLQHFIQQGDDEKTQELLDFYFNPYAFLFQKNNFGFGFWAVLFICLFRVIEDFIFNRQHDSKSLNFFDLFKQQNYSIYLDACENNYKNIIQFCHQYILSTLDDQELFNIYQYLISNEHLDAIEEFRLFLQQKDINYTNWDLKLVNSQTVFYFLYEKINVENKKLFVIQSFFKAVFQADLSWTLDILTIPEFNRYLSEQDYCVILSSIESDYLNGFNYFKNNPRFHLLKSLIKQEAIFSCMESHFQALLVFLIRDFIQENKNIQSKSNSQVIENAEDIDFIKFQLVPFVNKTTFFEKSDLIYLKKLIGESVITTESVIVNENIFPEQSTIEIPNNRSNNFFQDSAKVDSTIEKYPLSWAEKILSIFS